MSSQQSQIVPFQGGLDLVSNGISVKPGFCIAAENYEVTSTGYSRCEGYERFDGRPAPSEASYLILQFTQGTATILEGDTVTGLTSGASGIALVDMEVTSGTLAGGDALGRITLREVTGTFQDTEFLQVGGLSKARASGDGEENAAASDELHAAYIAEITAMRRTAIQPPAGSGPIRGVATFNGDTYAWRDDAGATAGLMFKATSGGWVQQDLGHLIFFDKGVVEPFEGDVITGFTSGATATIKRIARSAGAWGAAAAADQASGYFSLASITGTFQAGEPLQVGGITQASATAPQAAIALPAGATIRTHTENFYGAASRERLYFSTATGRAFEWDGTTLAPIRTGLSDALDKPTHIGAHKNHLFLAYPGGHVIGSSTGEPLTYDATTGAVEIAFGQEVTGMAPDYRDSLVFMGRNKIGYLVGFDYQDYELKDVTGSSGGVEGTLQVLTEPVFLDDLGVRSLSASEAYGDWGMGTMSYLIDPLIKSKRGGGVTALGSIKVRAKDQYRLYYSDGTALVMYVGRKDPEFLPLRLLFTASCFHSGEDSLGREVLLAGGADGYVYHLDKGTSFDGAVISAYVRLSFLHQGAPGVMKRYHRARLEGQAGANNASLFVSADFSYADGDQPTAPETDITFYGQGGFWGSAIWNEFFWSSPVEGQAWVEVSGIGENVSLVFGSESAVETPHTLSSITINFTPRRRLR